MVKVIIVGNLGDEKLFGDILFLFIMKKVLVLKILKEMLLDYLFEIEKMECVLKVSLCRFL